MNKIELFKCSKCGCKTFYVDRIAHFKSLLDLLWDKHYISKLTIRVICTKCGTSRNPLKESK